MALLAAAAPRKPAKGLAGETIKQLATELASDDTEVAVSAAKRLGELAMPEASLPLVEALVLGVRPGVAIEALTALGKLKDGRALPVLSLYAGNVNDFVRLAAVKAAGGLSETGAVDLLLDRLGDSAPPVRAAAAEALATRKEKRAGKRLLLLVTRNDPGAAGPLGMLISPEEIPRLVELQGRIDDGVLADALGEFLKRPEVPDRLRVDVIATLARLPGAAAIAALLEYIASVPDKEARPSKDEAQKLIEQRGGAK